MTRSIARTRGLAACAALLLALAGCGQPDGTMPSPQGDQPGRIEDISRDLQNVAAKNPEAPAELLDDLTYLDAAPRPANRLKELSQALSDALADKPLPDAEAKQVADVLFTAIAVRDLSEKQIEQVGTNLREVLVKVGSQAEAAERAKTAAVALASDVTQNKKRWYHR
jgi:hypothetical protein